MVAVSVIVSLPVPLFCLRSNRRSACKLGHDADRIFPLDGAHLVVVEPIRLQSFYVLDAAAERKVGAVHDLRHRYELQQRRKGIGIGGEAGNEIKPYEVGGRT